MDVSPRGWQKQDERGAKISTKGGNPFSIEYILGPKLFQMDKCKTSDTPSTCHEEVSKDRVMVDEDLDSPKKDLHSNAIEQKLKDEVMDDYHVDITRKKEMDMLGE